MANSSILVRPIITAPSAFNNLTTLQSSVATGLFLRSSLPQEVTYPFMSMLSLIATGTPANLPLNPFLTASSTLSACCKTSSHTQTKAFKRAFSFILLKISRAIDFADFAPDKTSSRILLTLSIVTKLLK